MPSVARIKKATSVAALPKRLRDEFDDRDNTESEFEDDSELDALLAEEEGETEPPTSRTGATAGDVLSQWLTEGPLIHEPTGIDRLDELTGGGPVYGSRWYLAGAPDAGKTALLVQLAHECAARGITVGILAVDEEAGDIVTRLAQRRGYSRHHCEARDPQVLDGLRRELGPLPLRIYGPEWTIEAAANEVAEHARERASVDPKAHPYGPRGLLAIDSLQTVTCEAERRRAEVSGRDVSTAEAVTERTRAIRSVASRHGLIVVTTSELSRSAYASGDPDRQTSTLAASKWSGAIEYSARVLLGLRSVSGEPDLIELEIAKNKHGPRDQRLHLRLDRRSQVLTEAAYEPPPKATKQDRDGEALARVQRDAVAVARALRERPGIGARELRAAVRAATGAGVERVDAALAHLDGAVVRGKGPRGAVPMTLEEAALPEAIKRAIEVSHG
jgi:hypothetical protein